MSNQSKKNILMKLAGSQYFNDVLELLEKLSDDAASVRTEIRGVESLESRQAICNYLDDTIDTIKRISQNESRRSLGIIDPPDDNI